MKHECETFRSWMDDKGALEAYLNNFCPLCDISRYRDLIVAGFKWRFSKEGVMYWSDIHDEWVDYCKREGIR